MEDGEAGLAWGRKCCRTPWELEDIADYRGSVAPFDFYVRCIYSIKK